MKPVELPNRQTTNHTHYNKVVRDLINQAAPGQWFDITDDIPGPDSSATKQALYTHVGKTYTPFEFTVKARRLYARITTDITYQEPAE